MINLKQINVNNTPEAQIQEVSVIQNTETGHTDISVGGTTTPVASVDDINSVVSGLLPNVEVGSINSSGKNADGYPARVRIKYFVKPLLNISLGSGFAFVSVFRYTLHNNNVLTFVDTSSLSGSSYSTTDTSYVYRFVFNKTDNSDFTSSDLDGLFASFDSYEIPTGQIANANTKPVKGDDIYNALTEKSAGFISDDVNKGGDGNILVRSRGVYDAVQLSSDLSLVIELNSIGATGNNGAGSARMRTKFYLKAPFKIVLNTGYVFYTISRYTIGNNNVITYVDQSSITGTELEKTDTNYIYRIVLKRSDNADTHTSDLSAAISSYKSYLDYQNGVNDRVNQNVSDYTPSTWVAMGDSITYGWYSYLDDNDQPQSDYNTNVSWAKQVSLITGKTLINDARGGTGYTADKNGEAICARVNVDTLITRGDFTNADLVTLAFGVNDWKQNCVLGTMEDTVSPTNTNIIPSMRYVIERILATKPTIKIVVIMPLNCCAVGNEAGNWGIGYSYSNNGTLENIYTAFKTVCDYYGIEYIDMLHYSCINRKNITSLLPDNVHPTIDAHKILGRELAKKISCF